MNNQRSTTEAIELEMRGGELPSSPLRCYAILRDGVYEGVEHFRYRLCPGGAELVNFEFTLPNGHQWRDGVPAKDIFKDRESAQIEWDRRFA